MKYLLCVDNPVSKMYFTKLVNDQTDICVLGEALGGPGPYDLIVVQVDQERLNLEDDKWLAKRLPLTLAPKGRVQYI